MLSGYQRPDMAPDSGHTLGEKRLSHSCHSNANDDNAIDLFSYFKYFNSQL